MRVNFVSENLTTLTFSGLTYAVDLSKGTKQRLCCNANDPDPSESPDDYGNSKITPDEWECINEALARRNTNP